MMFNFLDIKFSSYSLYMFWIIALVILSIFLPFQKKNILTMNL